MGIIKDNRKTHRLPDRCPKCDSFVMMDIEWFKRNNYPKTGEVKCSKCSFTGILYFPKIEDFYEL